MTEKCKKCGIDVEGNYSEVMEDRELVAVDEQTTQAIVLNKGDCLCELCSKVVTYYRRVRCLANLKSQR